MNFIKQHRIAIFALGLVILVAGFLAFRPDKLFVDDAVDESLTDAFAAAGPAPTETTVASQSEAVDTEPAETVEIETEDQTEPAPQDAPTSTASDAGDSTGPLAVTTGEFYGIDHSATGTATIYEQNGEYVLRLEDNTDIQNGPDLYVWVLPAGDFDGEDPVEYIDLGRLKGNVGGQNYQLPDDFDPALHETVLIWCLRFGVPFAAAPLG
jgi:hypothetical protein